MPTSSQDLESEGGEERHENLGTSFIVYNAVLLLFQHCTYYTEFKNREIADGDCSTTWLLDCACGHGRP